MSCLFCETHNLFIYNYLSKKSKQTYKLIDTCSSNEARSNSLGLVIIKGLTEKVIVSYKSEN